MKYIIGFSMLILLVGCSKQENNISLDITPEKISQTSEYQEQTEQIQKQIEELNTPTSDYPFFSVQPGIGNIDEIIKKGGMEITRGNIYKTGLGLEYDFLNKILTSDEKKYSFHNQNERFFYSVQGSQNIFKLIKNNFEKAQIKELSPTTSEINFSYQGKTYYMTLSFPKNEIRDLLDTILSTDNKTKIYIFSL